MEYVTAFAFRPNVVGGSLCACERGTTTIAINPNANRRRRYMIPSLVIGNGSPLPAGIVNAHSRKRNANRPGKWPVPESVSAPKPRYSADMLASLLIPANPHSQSIARSRAGMAGHLDCQGFFVNTLLTLVVYRADNGDANGDFFVNLAALRRLHPHPILG
jgi:hypothetical protein